MFQISFLVFLVNKINNRFCVSPTAVTRQTPEWGVWDLLKYEICRFTCEYCAKKKEDNKEEEQYLHMRLEDLKIKHGMTSDNSTNTEYYECKERLMEIEKVKAEGAIIRSKVKCIEEGERSTQYIFGLENLITLKNTCGNLYLIMAM